MYTDWFMGGVALVIGVVALAHGILPREQPFTLPKLRWFEQTYGRGATRILLTVVGVALIMLGVAIALGWKMHWPEESRVGQRASAPR